MSTDFEMTLPELMKIAAGGRTQKEFCAACGITESQYSRILNGKLKRPPRESTLLKVAQQSGGRVSFSDLMAAAGYRYIIDSRNTLPITKRHLTACVLSTVFSLEREFYVSHTDGFDLTVTIAYTDNLFYWHFKCASEKEPDIKKDYQDVLYVPCGNTTRISFISDRPSVAEKYAALLPPSISANLSVIVVDPVSLTIVKEHLLKETADAPAFPYAF